jgi:hypothetical protein
MRESKRKLIFTTLDVCYGAKASMVKRQIRDAATALAAGVPSDHPTVNRERSLFSAATVAATRCASFQQATNLVRKWAGVQ